MSGENGIIELTLSHLDAMTALHMNTIELHNELHPDVFWRDPDPGSSRAYIAGFLPPKWNIFKRNKGSAIGLEKKGFLAGYLLYTADNPLLGFGFTSPGLFIVDIAVDPDFKGQGIGRRMIEDVSRRAAKVGIHVNIHATIWEGNAPSKRLFEDMGFQPKFTAYSLAPETLNKHDKP